MMKLVSSWSHYLDFQCEDCGETTHVDATEILPATVACRSGKCRNSRTLTKADDDCDRPIPIGTSAGHREG